MNEDTSWYFERLFERLDRLIELLEKPHKDSLDSTTETEPMIVQDVWRQEAKQKSEHETQS